MLCSVSPNVCVVLGCAGVCFIASFFVAHWYEPSWAALWCCEYVYNVTMRSWLIAYSTWVHPWIHKGYFFDIQTTCTNFWKTPLIRSSRHLMDTYIYIYIFSQNSDISSRNDTWETHLRHTFHMLLIGIRNVPLFHIGVNDKPAGKINRKRTN